MRPVTITTKKRKTANENIGIIEHTNKKIKLHHSNAHVGALDFFDVCIPNELIVIIWAHVLDTVVAVSGIYRPTYRWEYGTYFKKKIQLLHERYAICKTWLYHMKEIYDKVSEIRIERFLGLDYIPKPLLKALGGFEAAVSLPVLKDLVTAPTYEFCSFVIPNNMPFAVATGIHLKTKIIFLNLVYKETGESGILAIVERWPPGNSNPVDYMSNTRWSQWAVHGFCPLGFSWEREIYNKGSCYSCLDYEETGNFIKDLLQGKQKRFALKHV